MWVHYGLTMRCGELVGGVPRHPDIIRRWQEARWPAKAVMPDGDKAGSVDEATARTVLQLGDQAFSEEEVSGAWTGFLSDGGGLVLEARAVKAMLKESANVCKALMLVRGKPVPLRARLAERVFVEPRLIPLSVATPSGTREKPIHVMTARGPRTALKRTDYVSDVELVCRLKVLDDGFITEAMLRTILDHASVNGLGTDRSQGYGTFAYDLVRQED